MNIKTGARAAPANEIVEIEPPTLHLRPAPPRTPRYRDSVSGEEYNEFVAESVRHYEPPLPPAAPPAPVVTQPDADHVQLTTPSTLLARAAWFTV